MAIRVTSDGMLTGPLDRVIFIWALATIPYPQQRQSVTESAMYIFKI